MTMNTQHTPGPWRMLWDDGWTVSADEVIGYVDIASVSHGRNNYTVESNARLIAAAPDLLAACQAIREWLAAVGTKDGNSCALECGRLARAAIAKTEGGAL